MRIVVVLLSVVWLLGDNAGAEAAESQFSLGVGVGGAGSLYSALGINLAAWNETSMHYVSVGVRGRDEEGSVSGTTRTSRVRVLYDAGIGLVRTDILAEDTRRHGLGIGLGIATPGFYDHGPRVRIGVIYSYFFRGMGASGFTLGFMPAITVSGGDHVISISPHLGYQF